MRNIESKARVRDLGAAEQTAKRLAGPEPYAALTQRDTYFHVPEGRLKLREIAGSEERAEIIFYRRPVGSTTSLRAIGASAGGALTGRRGADRPGRRRCEYDIAPVADPGALGRVLAEALGVRCVVEKRRTVYLWKLEGGPTVRIHLDRVDGLGEFVEFEAVMPGGVPDSEGEALLKRLLDEFGVAPGDTLAGSYADMVAGASQAQPSGTRHPT